MAFPQWFIRQKGLQLTARYQDMQNAAHARAFTVVKVAQLSALAQIKKDMAEAVKQGKSWQQFKKNYLASGKPPLREWHLKTVYQTNMQAAFMAGRHAAAIEATETHPYWLYLAEMDAYTRPHHADLHLRAFRHDDPIWASIVPPNGYNCRCRFIAISEDGLKEWGVTPEKGQSADRQAADKGFNSSPMASHTLDKLLYERAQAVFGDTRAHAFIQSVLLNPARLKGWEAFINSVLVTKAERAPPQGRAMAFAVLPLDDMAYVQAQGANLQNGLIFLEERQFAGKKWKRHKEAGDNLTTQEFRGLPELFAKANSGAGAIVLWDSAENNLIYLIPTGDKQGRFYKIPVRFNRNQYSGMSIDDVTTTFKIKPQDIDAMLKSPEIQKIR